MGFYELMTMLTDFVKVIKKVLSEVTQTLAFKEKILTDTKRTQNGAQIVEEVWTMRNNH